MSVKNKNMQPYKKLKIAIMLSGNIPLSPPKDYKEPFAPLEMAIRIAEGLAEKGHKIFFFSPKGSKSKKFKICEANFQPFYKNKILKDYKIPCNEREKFNYLFEQYLICLILKKHQKENFDIVHIHPIDRGLPFGFLFSKIPFVYTLHDPVSPWRREEFRLYKTKNQHLISISKAQQKPTPDLNWTETIYNGIKLESFPFSSKPKKNLLFLGRLHEKKGVDIAIKVALKLKQNLIIVGSPYKEEEKFWREKVKPYLQKKEIKYVGYVPYEKTFKYYGEAKALLCPIRWEEPFGLTFIESMACGTPVITFNRGSASEIIVEGKTGFIVKNTAAMIKAVKKIDQIDRRECRKHVEKNFTIEKMVDGYEKVYYKILNKKK